MASFVAVISALHPVAQLQQALAHVVTLLVG